MADTSRHDAVLEQGLLGIMLTNAEAIDEITAAGCGAADFYKPRHGELFTAIIALRDSGKPVDALTLAHALEPAELKRLGGAEYLATCMEAAGNPGSVGYYAKNLRNLAKLRQVNTLGVTLQNWAGSYTPDTADQLIERLQASASELALGGLTTAHVPAWDQLAAEAVDEIDRIQQLAGSKQLPGVPTGWRDLDRLLNNLQGGQVVVIAGRPGIGKSVAGRGIAQHNAMRRRMPSLLFSLEMSGRECAMALISAGAGVPLHNIRSGNLTDNDWTKIARYLGDHERAPLYVDDTPGAGLAHAHTVMRRLIREGNKPGVVVWDYLQLTEIPGYDGRRQEAVSALSRGFKLFAKEHDIPVVLISQLNRGPEHRSDKRPALSDLRESGSIEQDSDVVILLHRDDYYDKESPRAGEIDFIVAKNRHGSTDTITLAAQLHLQRFMDFALAA